MTNARSTPDGIDRRRCHVPAEEKRARLPARIPPDLSAASWSAVRAAGWAGTSIAIHAITETRLLPAKTPRFIEFLQEQMGRAQP
ncbi:hypothetical protein [Ensifer sp. B1-9]|uniref:hypothetical protein n=1 Tax=Ensifer sp. B1-9 TaxID=3141455 RepID=UPI003D1E85B1